MTGQSLAKHPFNFHNRGELKTLFRRYLQVSKDVEQLTWESITTENGLPHNWIYDLFEDSLGNIWIGTWGGGLGKFASGNWQIYTKKHGLHCNEVTCIREDKSGRIWIATDDGLNVMDDHTIKDAGLAGKSLLNITFDQNGFLWAGCWRAASSGGGLFRFNNNRWDIYSTRDHLPGLEILKVFNDSHERVWVGTYENGIGAGVGCFDGNRWRSYSTKDGLINNCVYSMFEDPSGNMWFGTVEGISIFDGSSWHRITKKDGLVDNRIYCMMIDSQKKMWFGTEEGISRFDGQNWLSYTKKDGLIENLVRTIIETKDRALWFGTYPYTVGNGGVSIARYDVIKSLTDHVLDLLPEPPHPKELPPGNS